MGVFFFSFFFCVGSSLFILFVMLFISLLGVSCLLVSCLDCDCDFDFIRDPCPWLERRDIGAAGALSGIRSVAGAEHFMPTTFAFAYINSIAGQNDYKNWRISRFSLVWSLVSVVFFVRVVQPKPTECSRKVWHMLYAPNAPSLTCVYVKKKNIQNTKHSTHQTQVQSALHV